MPASSVGSGEKEGWKFSSTGERAPGYRLSPKCFQKFKRMPAPDLHKTCFVLLCPIGEQFLLSSFREFVHDCYCLDHGLPGSSTTEMHAVRKLSAWNKIPIWFQTTVYPKTKDGFPKVQAWACKRYSRLHLSRLKEFLKDTRRLTTTKTSHGKVNSYFFSFYRDYSNSLTFTNASELFWSWIYINHIQVHEENEFCHCLFTSLTKHGWLGIFTGSCAVDGKEMYKKVWCSCKAFFCLYKLLLLWLSRRRRTLNFLLFTIKRDESKTEYSRSNLNCSCW